MMNTNEKLDLAVRIWVDFFTRTEENKNSSHSSYITSKLLRDANALCECFDIPKKTSIEGRKIASKRSGEKNV